jgi:holo-[acyl-carrier protein] synthase
MILGVGVDLTPIHRMEAALGRHGGRFEAKLFTEAERQYCQAAAQPAERFAARFAAKEAVVKAVPVLRGQAWHDVEVVRDVAGAPAIVLHGAAAVDARRVGVTRIHLSLSHAGGQAIAFVVAEG